MMSYMLPSCRADKGKCVGLSLLVPMAEQEDKRHTAALLYALGCD